MQQGYPAPGGYHNTNSTSSPASTAATGTAVTSNKSAQLNGGRFDFDDGGTYCGGWEDGKAHGHGVCTGPKGQGAYCGSWHFGFEVSGVYTWPSGSAYEGQWQNGKRHGMGVESRGRWIYRGEWTQGFKGRYGVRQSTTSSAKYEGTWANGLQDGYGSETYADGGTYQGQWLRGMRHGYGVRASAPFGLASHYRPKQTLRASLTSLRSNEGAGNNNVPASVEAAVAAAERDRRIDDSRGGFVLKARSDEPPQRRRSLVEKSLKKSILSGLKMRKQRSTGDLEKRLTSGGSIRSTASSTSWMSTESSQSGPNGGSFHTDSNASFVVEDEHMDANVTETYMGEWKNDKRSGFGISERSDGLRYEGEWFNNKKYGYGVTIHRDGSREEGKYKNNVLITSQKKKHIFLIRSAKFRERIDAAVNAAQRASKIALQKADIAISRMATARGKAEMADASAFQAREDFEIARMTAKQFAPEFTQPNLDKIQLRDLSKYKLSLEEKLAAQQAQSGMNDSSAENSSSMGPASGQNASSNANPPLPPRGQTPQSFSHRQSLSQFQPRSLYAHKDPPPPSSNPSNPSTSAQLPFQQHNYMPSTPTRGDQHNNSSSQYNSSQNYQKPANAQYGGQDYTQNQTEQIHSQNQAGYKPTYQTKPDVYSSQRPSVDQIPPSHLLGHDQIPPHLQTNRPYLTKQQSTNQYPSASGSAKYPPNHYPAHSSQYPYHVNSGPPPPQRDRDSNPDGYRTPLVDYSSSSQQPNLDSKTAYTNRINSADPNESYQRNAAIRRNSKPVSGESPYSFKQAMSDHFDHYTRPPSRDSSVDRYTRAASRLSGNSRQPSVDRTKPPEPMQPDSRSGSVFRAMTPVQANTGNGSVTGMNPVPNRIPSNNGQAPFEDFILRKRSIGQDIVPSPVGHPKRTESLYVVPNKKDSMNKSTPVATQIQRKKSMPDFQVLPNATSGMSREEVSVLSSARREEMRRLQEENERLRANPLLYLVSPHVKEWFSRQQLLMLVLFVNISLAFVFYKMLT
ncbi:junctophilin-1 isoform X2 [Planococcus citri]|uniref:junctophilin-1 isoform X2 n=1 Tax=Planococcus citri TaxID=170843 RepID=UPI0031F7302B